MFSSILTKLADFLALHTVSPAPCTRSWLIRPEIFVILQPVTSVSHLSMYQCGRLVAKTGSGRWPGLQLCNRPDCPPGKRGPVTNLIFL